MWRSGRRQSCLSCLHVVLTGAGGVGGKQKRAVSQCGLEAGKLFCTPGWLLGTLGRYLGSLEEAGGAAETVRGVGSF